MKNNFNQLAIYKHAHLTKAQNSLYALVCEKIESNEKLEFQEARNIYVNQVNRYVINGVPHRYNYYVPTDEEGKYTSKLQPMTNEEINFTTAHWLITNLGNLILKGYLVVLPAVELKSLN